MKSLCGAVVLAFFVGCVLGAIIASIRGFNIAASMLISGMLSGAATLGKGFRQRMKTEENSSRECHQDGDERKIEVAMLAYNEARKSYNSGNFQEASVLFQRAYKFMESFIRDIPPYNPDIYHYYFLLGNVDLSLGKSEMNLAINSSEHSGPSNARLQYLRSAQKWCERSTRDIGNAISLNDHDKGKGLREKSESFFPTLADAFLTLGLIMNLLSESDRAIKYCDEAKNSCKEGLEIDSMNTLLLSIAADAASTQAFTYVQLCKYPEAVKYYEEAIALYDQAIKCDPQNEAYINTCKSIREKLADLRKREP